MPFKKLLIANRGEIAIRVARAAADLGLTTVAVAAADDSSSLHLRAADEAHTLSAAGPAAYLDIAALVALARQTGVTPSTPATASSARVPPSPKRWARRGSASWVRHPPSWNCSATRQPRGRSPGGAACPSWRGRRPRARLRSRRSSPRCRPARR